MSLWGRAFAALYDPVMGTVERRGMAERRRALLGSLTGRVVEIGAGTGANVDAYGPGVDELVLCEPEEPMARRLERRLAASGRAGRVVRAGADALPLGDGEADAVVSTLVLCTVPDPARALGEARRVLAPGGALVVIEHVRSPDPRLARWQDRFTPIQKVIGHGCHPNRDTLAAV